MKTYSKPTLSIVDLQPKETIANVDKMIKRPLNQYVKSDNSQCGANWTYYNLSLPSSSGCS